MHVYSHEWFETLGRINAGQAGWTREVFRRHGKTGCIVCGDFATVKSEVDGLPVQFCEICSKIQASA